MMMRMLDMVLWSSVSKVLQKLKEKDCAPVFWPVAGGRINKSSPLVPLNESDLDCRSPWFEARIEVGFVKFLTCQLNSTTLLIGRIAIAAWRGTS